MKMPLKENFVRKIILDSHTNILICMLLISFSFIGCTGMPGGTHGSIKAYEYSVSKSILEKAVWKVINSNANIRRDTIYQNDGIKYGYYNDSINYISFSIAKNSFVNDYTIKFAGDSLFYDTSKVAAISVAYAWNKDANGGHEGIHGKIKKELIDLLEIEFINKIDGILGLKHNKIK